MSDDAKDTARQPPTTTPSPGKPSACSCGLFNANTYDQMQRAQARTEDWLTSRGEYSVEALREILDMIIERRVA